ncbi:hypothetical protein Hypma_000703 [Hypsizygus marmoreus]|uniref:G-patch domain-containing protein n=1 Tax=Hypsizygus marmoreus TaxID=39966 RepID=A0A369J7J5_HYPMA|nr:hypothetical protein Hypma_000703 [Hypsizygus marmoreus]
MATTSHTIYSLYEPREDKSPIRETSPEEDGSDSWRYDTSFGPARPPPPRFVPASVPSDTWNSSHIASSSNKPYSPLGAHLSSWYRSLSSQEESEELPNTDVGVVPPPHSPRSTEASPPSSSYGRPREKRNKNNWFIMNAIQSEPLVQPDSRPPSLAEIIARDPPPLPSEGKYTPPVWLEIGPSNKGFAMLQRSGWSEGEPLGPDVVRRPTGTSHADMIPLIGTKRTEVGKQEILEVELADFDGVNELRKVDIIDLTLSDSEDEDEADDDKRSRGVGETHKDSESSHPPAHPEGTLTHGRTALITPIATVLKSDRLGIGLKAKTVGPYKASQKRITHNAAMLAAHIRAAEESRKRKKIYGRGKRGFTVQYKRNETDRKMLLAHLNN